MKTSGQAIDVLPTAHRDEPAAMRFLTKAIRRHGGPETVTIDGREAHAAALRNDTVESGTALVIRQVTYVHKIIETGSPRSAAGDTAQVRGHIMRAAQGLLAASEFMRMMKQRQRVVGRKSGLHGGRTVLRPGCLIVPLTIATIPPRNAYDRPTRGRR